MAPRIASTGVPPRYNDAHAPVVGTARTRRDLLSGSHAAGPALVAPSSALRARRPRVSRRRGRGPVVSLCLVERAADARGFFRGSGERRRPLLPSGSLGGAPDS